jgi:hypothetical protein
MSKNACGTRARVLAAILIATSVSLSACSSEQSLQRSALANERDCQEFFGKRHPTEHQRQRDNSKPASQQCIAHRTPECRIQTTGRVSKYACE